MWASIPTFLITLLMKWVLTRQRKLRRGTNSSTEKCLTFVKKWLIIVLSAIQVALHEGFDLMGFDRMAECCTIASKTMMFFRHVFLKDNTIGVISQTGIAGRRNHSYESLLWLLLQEIHYPNLQYALSTRGEKVLLKAPVDEFHEATNTVFQFHGCPKCYREREQLKILSMKKHLTHSTPKPYGERNKLRNAGYRVVEKWSCEFSDEDRQRAHEFGLESKVWRPYRSYSFADHSNWRRYGEW